MTADPVKLEPISDAEFREITCRALDLIGLPSIGHVMMRLRRQQDILAECRENEHLQEMEPDLIRRIDEVLPDGE